MAPARHETPAGAGPPRENATKTSSIYGTRSSKRKSGEMSMNGESSSHNTSSSPSQKSSDAAAEPKVPPSKKPRRSSSTSIQQLVKTPESITPAEPESQSPILPEISEIPQVPEVTVDGPSGSSADDGASPEKSVGWAEAIQRVNAEESTIPEDVVVPATRGRGRGRGRGRWGGRGAGVAKAKPKPKPKGKGRWANRGSRGGRGRGAAVSGNSTPQVFGTPFAKGRGRGRGRNLIAPSIRALYDRKAHLKSQYDAVVKLQKIALSNLAAMSLSNLMSDPKYHETLPEYVKVQETLKQNYELHLANLKQEHERKVAYLLQARETETEYRNYQLTVSRSSLNLMTLLIVTTVLR